MQTIITTKFSPAETNHIVLPNSQTMVKSSPLLTLFIISFILHSYTSSSLSESDALLKLKNSFTNANALDSWTPGSVPCAGKINWAGVVCYNGIVTGLRLKGMGLSGIIDVDALLQIPGLRTISFVNNAFSGRIPELNRLGALKALYLSGNRFDGDIPSDFFAKMESLKKIWLDNNMFSGNIPTSLEQLRFILELHLENNQFRGRMPSIDQPTLMSFNVSNNRLEGEIPKGFGKFDGTSFLGNKDLCGGILGKECVKGQDDTSNGLVSNPTKSGDNIKKILAGVITLSVLLLSVICLLIVKMRRKRKYSNVCSRESSEHKSVEVNLPESNRKIEPPVAEVCTKDVELCRKGSSRKVPNKGVSELSVVNDEKGVFGLQDLMKASAEVLGNGCLGSSYKALMSNGVWVAVKKMREMNVMSKDGFHAELKRLGSLRHPNILTPLAYHFRREEKLLVYEYIPKGSLLYLLHGNHEASHTNLEWPIRLKIIRGIARGLAFLHVELASLDLPHGNLKSSNVLLSADNEPLLMDYGYSPLVNTAQVKQILFAYKAPEAVKYHQVSPKCDVYSLGIIILEILTRKYPSQYLNDNKGGTDVVQWAFSAISEGREAELFDPDIANTSDSYSQMAELLTIAVACTESNPEQRLHIGEAIRRIEAVQGIQDARAINVLSPNHDVYVDALESESADRSRTRAEGEPGHRSSDSFPF